MSNIILLFMAGAVGAACAVAAITAVKKATRGERNHGK